MTNEFCSIFIRKTVKQGRALNTWLVQTKFNITTICLDNHHQSFWQLISRLIQFVLALLSPGVDQNLLLIFCWSVSVILWRWTTTLFTLNNPRDLDLDCWTVRRLVFRFNELRHMGMQVSDGVVCRRSVLLEHEVVVRDTSNCRRLTKF